MNSSTRPAQISAHGTSTDCRNLIFGFAFLVLCFFACANRSQAATYSYVGPAFNIGDCQMFYGTPPTANLVDGNVSGTVTLTVPSDYSGLVSSSQIVDMSLSANGVGLGVNLSNCPTGLSLDMSNGQIIDWNLQIYETCSDTNQVVEIGGGLGSTIDAGAIRDPVSGDYTSVGFEYFRGGGAWTNPKILGQPTNEPPVIPDPTPSPVANQNPSSPRCSDPSSPSGSLSSCGDPIDIGSGNLFE